MWHIFSKILFDHNLGKKLWIELDFFLNRSTHQELASYVASFKRCDVPELLSSSVDFLYISTKGFILNFLLLIFYDRRKCF